MLAKPNKALDITKLTEVQLQELVRTQEKLIEDLESANAKLKALLFGRKSERYAESNHPELPFADEPQPAPPPHVDEVPDEESDHLEHKAKKKHRSRGTRRLPENLPRERFVIELAADERRCRCCNEAMKVIGEEKTELLDYNPASFCIREIVRLKYACAAHEESGVCIAELPKRPIPKGMASPRLIAHVLNAKYDDHRVPRRHAQPPQGRRSKSCCIEDEGWPLGIGVQASVSIHLELRGLRARVVSVEGNGAARLRQERSKKTSESEPLMTCREVFTRRRNQAVWLAWDESRGYLITDWTASGMKAA